MSVKKFNVSTGRWEVFPGTVGLPGKSAYEIAQEEGYTGTKEQYYRLLANIGNFGNEFNSLKDDILRQLRESIEDNLNSYNANKSLSANQGRILKDMISNISSFRFQKVDELPSVGETNVLYLVQNGENHDEYIWIDAWELVGSTNVDLSILNNYYTKDEVVSLLNNLEIEDFNNYYTKSEVDNLVKNISNLANYYTKDEMDNIINGLQIGEVSVDWDNIQNKPITFTPSAHKHTLADIEGEIIVGDGNSVKMMYAKTNYGEVAPNVNKNNTNPGSDWSENVPVMSDGIIWCITTYINSNGDIIKDWSDPFILSGVNGKDGADGSSIEFIFIRSNSNVDNWNGYKPVSDSSNSNPSKPVVDGVVFDDMWSDEPRGVDGEMRYEWSSIRRKDNNVWSEYSVPTLFSYYAKDGIAPQSYFTSIVFTRTNDDISAAVVNGGDYNEPIPDTTSYNGKNYVWTDGIPNGEEIIWSVTRTFQSYEGDDSIWSSPKKMSDTSDFDVAFSSSITKPNPPANHPNLEDSVWSNSADENTIWMATSTKHNGVWTDWVIAKIKGEKGDAGTSINLLGAKNSVDELPMEGNKIGDCYSVNGELYVWDGDNWQNAGQIKGEPGDSYYLHIKYSNDGGLTFTDNNGEDPGDWIGLCNTTSIENPDGSDPDEPSVYRWKKWKGEDGFGFEYIYCRTQNNSAPATPSSPDNYETDEDFQRFDFVPVGWTDNASGVSEEWPYEWVCYRTLVAGKWQPWKGSASNNSVAGLYAKFAFDGLDGKDGSDVEYAYKLYVDESSEIDEDINVINSISMISGSNEWDEERFLREFNRYHSNQVNQMTDHPTGVDDINIIERYIVRRKAAGVSTWDNWSGPYIWSKWGRDGHDGDGVEYIYARSNYNYIVPEIPTNLNNPDNLNFQQDEYLPNASELNKTWFDNPQGVNEVDKFEWVSVRKYDGETKLWKAFSEPKLWAKWSDDGVVNNYHNYVYYLSEEKPLAPTDYNNVQNLISANIGWVDYPDSSVVDNKIWWQCIATVNGETDEVITWSAVIPVNGKNGEEGYSIAQRFAVFPTSYGYDTIPSVLDDFNQYEITNGTSAVWKVSIDSFDSNTHAAWMTTASVRYEDPNDPENNNILYRGTNWSTPIKISGEKGEVGPVGGIGDPGADGLPGKYYIYLYCYGDKNGVKPGVDLNFNNPAKTVSELISTNNWSETAGQEDLNAEYGYIWYIQGRVNPELIDGEISYDKIEGQWNGPFRSSGADGNGEPGKMIYPAGVWNSDSIYKQSDSATPYVYYEGSYYILNKPQANVGVPPISSSGEVSADWIAAEYMDAIFAKVGVIAHGLIGSAVFYGDYMFSQNGGVLYSDGWHLSNSYEDFNESSITIVETLLRSEAHENNLADQINADGEIEGAWFPFVLLDLNYGGGWFSRGEIIFDSFGNSYMNKSNINLAEISNCNITGIGNIAGGIFRNNYIFSTKGYNNVSAEVDYNNISTSSNGVYGKEFIPKLSMNLNDGVLEMNGIIAGKQMPEYSVTNGNLTISTKTVNFLSNISLDTNGLYSKIDSNIVFSLIGGKYSDGNYAELNLCNSSVVLRSSGTESSLYLNGYSKDLLVYSNKIVTTDGQIIFEDLLKSNSILKNMVLPLVGSNAHVAPGCIYTTTSNNSAVLESIGNGTYPIRIILGDNWNSRNGNCESKIILPAKASVFFYYSYENSDTHNDIIVNNFGRNQDTDNLWETRKYAIYTICKVPVASSTDDASVLNISYSYDTVVKVEYF